MRRESLTEAATELGVDVHTIRAWIRRGAPVVQIGGPGRGNGTLVNPDALRRWRNGGDDDELVLRAVAEAISDMYSRDGGLEERPVAAWRTLLIPRAATAALLLLTYRRIHRKVTGEDLEELPPELQALVQVYVDSSGRSFGRD